MDLIIENKDYTEELKNLLDSLPFSRIVLIDKLTQISQRLNVGDISYYIDDDPVRRGLVNSPHALSFKQLQQMLRRGKVWHLM